MLFTNDQRRRVLAGEMTATIRAWQAPQVKAGKRYRFDDEHELVVHTVELTSLDALTPADLAAAGFGSRADFDAALPRFANDRPTGPFYVVRFTLEPRRQLPPAAPPEIEKLLARLDKLDRLSEHGPWTRATLATIAANPRLVSTKLAEQLSRERFSLKADVRKLKAMGLTRSHDVGYDITDLGRQVLAAVDDAAPPLPRSRKRGSGGEGAAGPAATEGRDSSARVSPSPRARGEGAGG
ncbi:MAG: ASCH domain-containing protein [Dehalococcoidia bacterium]